MKALGIAAALLALVACDDGDAEPEADVRAILGVPDALQIPYYPPENPPTVEKVALGRQLFFDVRLSGNGTQACASCHAQGHGFADTRMPSVGSTGETLVRQSQGLQNAAYNSTFTWANNGLTTLEKQIAVPIRGDHPVELGVSDGLASEVMRRFDDDPETAALFRAAFPDSPSGATVDKVIFALATFIRTMTGADSPYDHYLAGDREALSESARRGLALFNGERFECFHCHSGVNLSTSYRDLRTRPDAVSAPFFNNGLYNVGGDGSYPASDQGLFDVTRNADDKGMFRPQSLRNVALSAPYMHDGSIATLEDVVRHYAAGGRNIASGPDAGDGRLSPQKSGLVRGFVVTDQEIADVVAFLESLTDPTFIDDPRFTDPRADR